MSKKLVIIIVAVVVVLGGGGAAAALLLLRAPAEAADTDAVVEPQSDLVSLDSFVVNLNDEQSDRYAKITLQLIVRPPEAATAIRTDSLLRARIRDRTLTLLASKTYETLITPLGKESLRREIKAHLDPLFEDGEIEDVLFSEFMVQ